MKLSLKQIILTIFLILTPVFLSMLPFFIQSYMSPADRVFTGLHRWSEDYYGYLHTINQGLIGHLQAVSKLTNEPHQATFVHSEYAVLGLAGHIFGLNSPLVYHLSRLFLGAIFVIIAFYFLFFLFTKNRKRVTDAEVGSRKQYQRDDWQDPIFYTIVAFFLAFFVGGFPHIISIQPLQIEPYLSWWTELDVLTRSTILPHYLMGNIFFLLIIILFLKNTLIPKYLNTKYLILLGIFSFLLAFVHSIDFLILGCTLGTFVFFQIIIYWLRSKVYTLPNLLKTILSTKYQIQLLLLVFVSGLIPAIYYRYALSLPFWRFILAHGTTTSYDIPFFDLAMALGPVFFLGIIGIIVSLKYFQTGGDQRGAPKLGSPSGKIFGAVGRQDPSIILLLFSWLFVQTLFFLKFYQIFNFDRLRTMEAPFYIPLAFFSTYILFRLIPSTKYKILILVLVLLSTMPTTIIGLKNQIFTNSDFKTFSLFSYPTVKQYQSWEFLKNNTPDNSLITSLYEEKFLIPTVSGNKIAFGANFDNDKNYQNNVNMVNKMYAGLLSPEDAQNFLHTYHIQYVYWGYQEQSLGGDLTKYSFLQKIFSNGEVIIFKVK